MRRRELIAGLSATAAASPLRTWAKDRMRRVGMLSSYGESDPEIKDWMEAFTSRLRELGWTAGANSF